MNITENLTAMLILFILITIKINAQGGDGEKEAVALTPFSFLGKNITESYTNRNLLFHLGAVGLTYLIVESNLDARILETTSKMDYNTSEMLGMPGIIIGYSAPILVPVGMYLFSQKNSHLRNASFAVIQAVGVSTLTNLILKSITGRTPPDPDHPDKKLLSRDFNFSFFGGGIHYGWPSGHIMTNMAMVTALTSYYNNINWLKYLSYGYVSVLAVTVLIDERGSAHWLSEIIAGGLMGYAIGTSIGKNFREGSRTKTSNKTSVNWSPNIGSNYFGISIGIKF
ncbi:phosphatase PAP2 family protein [Bacteroidota bacterium]